MEKKTVLSIQKKKRSKDPITALTCYDAYTARLVDLADIDLALVGDSLANTRLGYPNTLPVTFEEMLHHVRAAARGCRNALLVADMPFLSYEWAPSEAARTAGLFIKSGGAAAVKVEGGKRVAESIKAILNANIPVLGHIGLTPQSVHIKGGYFVQGKDARAAKALIADAKLLERLGVFGIVIEGVPAALGRRLSRAVKVPTIGIGAGPDCDGQILVLDDVLGFTIGRTPKFVKRYADLGEAASKAVTRYRDDVLKRRFPDRSHSY